MTTGGLFFTETKMKVENIILAVGIALGVSASSLVPQQSTLASVSALEDQYFATTGKYLQILPGSQLPSYEKGTVIEKLGQDVPANVSVGTYQSPTGPGYFVRYTDAQGDYSYGTGPEESRGSYVHLKKQDVVSATSTP